MKKIPDNAKKVFEGERFVVWQWDQELFDKTHTIFESVTRADVSTTIAITREKKILFLKEEQSGKSIMYTFPSGTLDQGDTPLSCVKRELKEETGYTTNDITLWCTKSAGNSVIYDYHIFIAKDCIKDGDQELDSGEKIQVFEHTLDEVLAIIEEVDFKNFALYPILLKAKYSNEYKQELEKLFGIETT